MPGAGARGVVPWVRMPERARTQESSPGRAGRPGHTAREAGAVVGLYTSGWLVSLCLVTPGRSPVLIRGKEGRACPVYHDPLQRRRGSHQAR